MLIFKGQVSNHLFTPEPGVVINPLHSHGDPDWYTPSPYVEAARIVMGKIDLDPASDADANKIVQATHYYVKAQNGLNLPWWGNVFINPPGEQVNLFWQKLMSEVEDGHTKQFIWIGFSLEQLQTLQSSSGGEWPWPVPLDCPICVPKKRIAFVENEAKRMERLQRCIKEGKTFKEKISPTHANYICYGGPYPTLFGVTFGEFGKVRL